MARPAQTSRFSFSSVQRKRSAIQAKSDPLKDPLASGGFVDPLVDPLSASTVLQNGAGAIQAKGDIQFEDDELQPKGDIQFEDDELQPKGDIQFDEDEDGVQPKGDIQFDEDEDGVQPKGDIQFGLNDEEEPMGRAQMKSSSTIQADGELQFNDVHSVAKSGFEGSGGSLPHLSTIQDSFGSFDVSGVSGHTDGAASLANQTLGSEAYASGESVAFNGMPDLHTAAHEAAHVVQQRHGVSLEGGVGKSGDSYEQHADAVADTVTRGESAESLLKPFS